MNNIYLGGSILKKAKKILAVIGIIILAGLYISTLVFALIDNEHSIKLLQASIYLTITFPVILYGITLIYKLLHKD